MAMPKRLRVVHPVGGEVKTKQGMKDEVNINSIIRRWRDGVPLPAAHRQPMYGDFSDSGSFHEALIKIDGAKEEFMRLPSEIRAACEQDMGIFLDKVHTEEGLKEMMQLGLDPDQAPADVIVEGRTPEEPEVPKEPEEPVEPEA